MFSPERYGVRAGSFGVVNELSGRNFVGLKTAFRNKKENRSPLQKAAHFRFSEPSTPSVLKERGLKPSDIKDPYKKQFLKELTGRVFHLSLQGTDQGLEGDKKISLERLFTPATDSGDLTPIKKKAFSSSAFYRPDHPTIDDQVELAQRISYSLVDDNNKMSRGQSMYMKRKKRSMRWIHQGEEELYEEFEGPEMDMLEDVNRPPARRPVSMPPLDEADNKEKPPMKLLMSSKGVQDFQQVQEHYENLMNQPAPPSPEVNKLVTEIASPTGKGAELFAKRKKRMDKFIVDETNVQRSSFSQQSSSSYSSSSSQNGKAITPAVNAMPKISTGVVSAPAGEPGAGAMYTAEVKVVQRASLPPTPIDVPHHSLLDLVTVEKSDKRLSASFNLAAKGWGTYNKFYTPVTFATKS